MKAKTTKPHLPADRPSNDELAETAVAAVRAAGKIQLQAFGTPAQAEIIHPKDLKLAVDRECENAIVGLIRSRFPRHRILAEEGGDLGGDGDYLWIVDPLDGTVNFFYGLPQFCALVACCRLPQGQLPPASGEELLDSALIGAVYAPVFDELYVGIAGQGATCNGKPIRAGRQKRLADVIVAFSFGKTDHAIDRMGHISSLLAKKARKVRNFGSAGLDIVRVAAGQFGGLLYRGIHIWDIAAAAVILNEAGGILTAAAQPDGKWNMVAAAAGVHDELLQIVSKP